MKRTFKVTFDPILRTAAVGMLKEGLKSPTIARLLRREQSTIEWHLGWWVHDRMRTVAGRTYRAYRDNAAADLRVSFQSAMQWHHRFLFVAQVSSISDLIAEATEEYVRQTPNVQREMQAQLRDRPAQLALLREFGYLK